MYKIFTTCTGHVQVYRICVLKAGIRPEDVDSKTKNINFDS